jgi:hypothetical protein
VFDWVGLSNSSNFVIFNFQFNSESLEVDNS